MTAPSRRRFSFSLRTLFVVVTVVAISAGWLVRQVKWQKNRERAIMELRQDRTVALGDKKCPPPWQIKMLGGMGWWRLQHVPASEVERYQRLFPEVDEILATDWMVYYRDKPPVSARRDR